MNPIENLLSRLSGVRKSGSGWVARCPAHEDRKPSLSIGEGRDGTVMIHCFAGCSAEAVVDALGLELKDLFPSAGGLASSQPRNKNRAATGPVYAKARAAVAALEARLGRRAALWAYHDASGSPVGLVLRWDTPTGKSIRPVSKFSDGWRCAAMPEPRPLYNLPELLKADPSTPVFVLEGEKCVDTARSFGWLATTSSGGAQAARKTDWRPLAGRTVYILPDGDAPGRRYADTVAEILLGLDPTTRIKIVHLYPAFETDGNDLADFIEFSQEGGLSDSQIREIIEEIAHKTPAWEPPARIATGEVAKTREVESEPDLICMANVEPAEVRWLWPGRIPLGKITLLAGRPGAGKSFLTCDIAARVSRGATWPVDLARAPRGDVLFITAEDDPGDTIRPRLDAHGADCSRVHLLRAENVIRGDGSEVSVAFDLTNIAPIRAALDRLPECKLIIVDPVGSFLGDRIDAHRDNEVRFVLGPLAALAADRGVAALLVCHTRKAPSSFADDAVLGSRGFTGIARAVQHLVNDPEDSSKRRRLLLPGKSNLGLPAPGLAFSIVGGPARLEWEQTLVEACADDVVCGMGGSSLPRGRPSSARDGAAAWLASFLGAGPRSATEVREAATEAGLSWATIRRAGEVLGIVPTKQTFSGRWMWALPCGREDAQKSEF